MRELVTRTPSVRAGNRTPSVRVESRTPHPFPVMLAYEVRRTWRSPLPWLLVLAAGLLAGGAPYLTGGAHGPAGWWAPALVRHRQTAFLLPLLGTLLSVYSAWEAQRDRRTRGEEVFLAWPLAAWQWHLARSLALGTVTLAAWLALAVPAAVHALASHGGAAPAAEGLSWIGPALRDVGVIAGDLLASLLGAQALGQVAAALVPGTGGLVALVLYRMFAVVAPGVVIGTLQWPHALLATPDLGTWYPLPSIRWQPYSEAFGLRPHQALFWTHRAFWALGSPAVLLALALLRHRRREARPSRSGLLGALALAGALAAAAPFLAHEQARVAAYQAALAAYGEAVKPELRLGPDDAGTDGSSSPAGTPQAEPPEPSGATAPTGAPPVTPLRYEIEADLRRAPEATLRAEVELLPRAATEEIRLTLRRVFRVETVAVNGRPVPAQTGVAAQGASPGGGDPSPGARGFWQQGDVVVVRLPEPASSDQPLRIAMTYRGRIADWRLAPYETPVALANAGMVVVPATWGWYPVPGEHRLTSEMALTSLVYRALMDRTRPFNDATPDFTVTVHTPPGIRALAGFTALGPAPGGGTTWRLAARRNRVSLLGGDWHIQDRGRLTYLVPAEELDTWEAAAADLHRLLTAILDWTGLESLAVAPHSLPDPHILGTEHLGPVFQAAPAREQLVDGLRRWLLLEWPSATRWAALSSDDEAEAAAAWDAWSLYNGVVGLVVDRAAAEAFGEAPDPGDGPGSDVRQRVEAWAARTPVLEQKRQLHALFAAARVRPLTPADFAFLDGGASGAP